MSNLNIPDTITSLEIAEITGKPHNDLMKAIRKMEEAWVKQGQGNFSLGSYLDKNNQSRPMFMLTKVECLYIATKFNDESRAKLVIRWEQLELNNQKFGLLPQNYEEALEHLLIEVKNNREIKARGDYEFEAREQKDKEIKLLKQQIARLEDKEDLKNTYRR